GNAHRDRARLHPTSPIKSGIRAAPAYYRSRRPEQPRPLLARRRERSPRIEAVVVSLRDDLAGAQLASRVAQLPRCRECRGVGGGGTPVPPCPAGGGGRFFSHVSFHQPG